MAVDASIYAQANKPSVALADPNAQLQPAASAANAVMQNRLLQAGQARGQLMQQAIDPTTGEYSPTAFNKLAAGNPTVAMAMPDAVQQSQNLMGNQQELATKQNAYMSSSLGAVLKVPDDSLHDAAASAMNSAVQQGLIKPQDALREMGLLPSDPAALRQHLTQLQMRLMTPQGQRDATYGTAASQSSGGTMQTGLTAPVDQPNGGAFQPKAATRLTPAPQFVGTGGANVPTSGGESLPGAPPIANTLPPTFRGQLVDITVETEPGSGKYIQRKVPYEAVYGNAPAQPSLGSGSYQQAPPVQSAGPQRSQAGATQGINQYPLAGTPADASSRLQADQKGYQDAQNSVKTQQDSMLALQHAYDALKLTNSGPGTETLQKMKAFLVARGVPVPQETTDQAVNFDLFRKAVNSYAGQQGAASNTDAGRTLAQHSNANVDNLPAANLEVLSQEMGKQRQNYAATITHADKSGAGFLDYKTNHIAGTDPRGFSVNMYTPEQNAAYVAGLKSADQKARFYKAAGMASRLGLIGSSGGAPAPRPDVPQGG